MNETIISGLLGLFGSGIGALCGIIVQSKLTNWRLKQIENKLNNKALDVGIKADLYAFAISSKISKNKSKLQTVFNEQLDKINNKASKIVSEGLDTIREIRKDVNMTPLEKKDKVNNLRTDKENELAIKRAQLESMRAAVESINQSGDVFANATPLIATSKVK